VDAPARCQDVFSNSRYLGQQLQVADLRHTDCYYESAAAAATSIEKNPYTHSGNGRVAVACSESALMQVKFSRPGKAQASLIRTAYLALPERWNQYARKNATQGAISKSVSHIIFMVATQHAHAQLQSTNLEADFCCWELLL